MTELRIGIVEDDERLRAEFVQLIDTSGDMHCVGAYASAEAALTALPSEAPDVVLMDINLPGMSGIEAMEILRADPSTAHIPIIALSANAVPRDIEKGLAAGFFNYLTKPIKVNQFMDALDAALEFSQTAASARASRTVEKEQA